MTIKSINPKVFNPPLNTMYIANRSLHYIASLTRSVTSQFCLFSLYVQALMFQTNIRQISSLTNTVSSYNSVLATFLPKWFKMPNRELKILPSSHVTSPQFCCSSSHPPQSQYLSHTARFGKQWYLPCCFSVSHSNWSELHVLLAANITEGLVLWEVQTIPNRAC